MDRVGRQKFDSWLEAYGRAWKYKDPKAAAELLAEEATYQETPFDEPARGHEAIAEYWSRVTAGHEGVRFDHEILMAEDEVGIARWASFQSLRSGTPVELDGIFVVRMDDDGRCEEFQEWWHLRQRDSEEG